MTNCIEKRIIVICIIGFNFTVNFCKVFKEEVRIYVIYKYIYIYINIYIYI